MEVRPADVQGGRGKQADGVLPTAPESVLGAGGVPKADGHLGDVQVPGQGVSPAVVRAGLQECSVLHDLWRAGSG